MRTNAGALQVLDQRPADDPGHDLVAVVDALAAPVSEPESARGSQVCRVRGRWFVGGFGHRGTIAEGRVPRLIVGIQAL
jgi:hypothetical protein